MTPLASLIVTTTLIHAAPRNPILTQVSDPRSDRATDQPYAAATTTCNAESTPPVSATHSTMGADVVATRRVEAARATTIGTMMPAGRQHHEEQHAVSVAWLRSNNASPLYGRHLQRERPRWYDAKGNTAGHDAHGNAASVALRGGHTDSPMAPLAAVDGRVGIQWGGWRWGRMGSVRKAAELPAEPPSVGPLEVEVRQPMRPLAPGRHVQGPPRWYEAVTAIEEPLRWYDTPTTLRGATPRCTSSALAFAVPASSNGAGELPAALSPTLATDGMDASVTSCSPSTALKSASEKAQHQALHVSYEDLSVATSRAAQRRMCALSPPRRSKRSSREGGLGNWRMGMLMRPAA